MRICFADADAVSKSALEDALSGSLSEDDAVETLAKVAEETGVSDGDLKRILSEFGMRSGLSDKKASMRTAGILDWSLSRFRGNGAMLKAIAALALTLGVGLHGYSVKDGDSLWKISGGKPSVMRKIMELNGLDENSVLKPGQEIVLPEEIHSDKQPRVALPSSPAKTSDLRIHVVKKGDTIWSIAREYKVKVDDLKKANPSIKNFDRIDVGQEIILPENAVDPKTDYVAKVLYAETSTRCSSEEVNLVARVIYNRIGDSRFGGGSDAYAVVSAKNAFSCTSGKDGNANWNQYSKDLNDAAKNAFDIAERLMRKDASGLPDDAEIVYYCNKSMAKAKATEDSPEIDGERYGYPDGWESDVWKPVPVKATDHFVFYKIEKKNKK